MLMKIIAQLNWIISSAKLYSRSSNDSLKLFTQMLTRSTNSAIEKCLNTGQNNFKKLKFKMQLLYIDMFVRDI